MITSIKCHDHWFIIVKIRCRRLNILKVVGILVSFDFIPLFMEKCRRKSEAPEDVTRWITNNFSFCSLSIQIMLETNMARFGTWITFAEGEGRECGSIKISCSMTDQKKWTKIDMIHLKLGLKRKQKLGLKSSLKIILGKDLLSILKNFWSDKKCLFKLQVFESF